MGSSTRLRRLSRSVPGSLRTSVVPGVFGLLLIGVLGLPLAAIEAQPRFEAPTPCGTIFRINPGVLLAFPVRARDDMGALVTLDVVTPPGLPPGASFFIPPPANPVEGTFSWTPTAADVGAHNLVFRATSQNGAALCRVFVKVPSIVTATVLRENIVVELTIELVQSGEIEVANDLTETTRTFQQDVAATTGTGRFFIGPVDTDLPLNTERIGEIIKEIQVTNLEPVTNVIDEETVIVGAIFNGVLVKTVPVEPGPPTEVTGAIQFAGFIPLEVPMPGQSVRVVSSRVAGESEELIDP